MTLEVLSNEAFVFEDQEFSDRLISIRRHLHAHPELGLQEYNTSAFIRNALSANGLSVSPPVARTGMFVDIEGAFPGPKIAYRSDIDALPITDTKTVSYRSQNEGVAHLCGHDAHTTIGIAIASLLHARRHQMHGSVRVFFQPNEEGMPSGAPLMMGDGVLEGIQAVYASHVDPTLPSGVYGLRTGACTASADRFRIRVLAESTGHSARPHQTTDTIWISTQIMTAIYQLVGRVSDSRSPAVISICRLKAGKAYNVLPAEAEFGGTLRCTEGSVRASLKSQMEQTACGIGQTFGAQVLVDFDKGVPPVVNNADLISTVRESILKNVSKMAIFDIPVPSMGGDDFAHYLDRVPGALVRIGTCNGPETAFVLHDSNFDIDESVLAKTAQMWADTLIFYLQKNSGV